MPQAIPTPTTAHCDPVIVLLAQHESLVERLANDDSPYRHNIVQELTAIEEQLTIAKATSAEGALAALHQLKTELQEFVLTDDAPATQLYLGLIDSVASYLRQQTRVAMAN